MQQFRGARFGGHSSFKAGQPMSDELIQARAPSVFAIDKHESRSARYSYIPTFEIVAGMRREGFDVVNAIQGGSRTAEKEAFTKHMLRFQHPDYRTGSMLPGVAPEVVLVNSHDGTSSYQLFAGVFRGICTNSMICMEDGAEELRIAHKGDILHEVIEGSFTVIGESRKTLEHAAEWNGLMIAPPEREILAEAAHIARFGDTEGNVNTPITPAQLLRPRRTEDRAANLWNVHNVIQENVIRGGLTAWGKDADGRARRVTTREVKAIDGDVKLNRALWHLSARMAELLRKAA